MDEEEARRRFSQARVARMATADVRGRPYVVPIVFAVDGEAIYSVVDAKPKRSLRLRRLANIEANPQVSLLVDQYDEDWGALWWARADGRARVVGTGPEYERAIALLRAKYPQYEVWAPIGPAIVVSVGAWRGWSAAVAPRRGPSA
jgi:PPOX class probable F420-dependent enzyme